MARHPPGGPVSPVVGPGRRADRHGRLGVRPDHPGGDLGVHVVQGVRRDLPGQHRDPGQDPRHAALPVADGVQLPDRARQDLPVPREPGEPVGPVQVEPGRLGQGAARRGRHRRWQRRRSPTSTCTGSAAPAASTTRTRRSPLATAKLLQRAGIDFAILGPSERCTGDPARRSGNEYLFQMLAMQNVETLNGDGGDRRSSPSARTASTPSATSTPSSAAATRSSTTASCSSG